MRFTLSRHFTKIFLYLCLIFYETSFSSISAYAIFSNSSEEIKNILSLPEVTDSILKGAPKTGNFAEGGPIIENLTQPSIKTSFRNFIRNSNSLNNISTSSYPIKKQNSSSLYTSLMPTKLTETEPNLFLGLLEVIHSNGTSSVKPRKGVDNENETSLGFSGNRPCLWLNENECYSAKKVKELNCFCCNESNILREEIKQQAYVNCQICNSDYTLPSESKQICKNICCNTVVHGIYSVTTTQDNYDYLDHLRLPNTKKKQHNSFISEISEAVSKSDFSKETVIEDKNSFNISKKNSKLKPSVTKVPYDVEVVTEILNKDQQKVFVPIIVLFFLLPLIGILMFFFWRRVKEYWDKRYYKRTDFLIDGIYND